MTINGFCKGAGMIAPDMATMLCFIFTDAAIAQPALQALLGQHVRDDLQLHDGRRRYLDQRHLPAVRHRRGGRARPAAGERGSAMRALEAFSAALHDLMRDLAIQVAKDGEGLSKFVTFEISGAESWAAARTDRALAAPTRRS